MIVPGSNLLQQALQIINPQGVRIQRYAGRVKGPAGVYVTSYAPAVCISGSFQPVNRSAYQTLGLDFSKSYVTLYTSAPVRVIDRDQTGDRVEYAGRLYEAQSDMDWRGQDGWSSYLFVEVKTP